MRKRQRLDPSCLQPSCSFLVVRYLVIGFLVTVSGLMAARADAAPTMAAYADAYVTEQSPQSWAIGAGGLEAVLGFDAQRRLSVQRVWNTNSGNDWPVWESSPITVTVSGQPLPLSLDGDIRLTGATADPLPTGVRLTLSFEHRATRTQIIRVYAAYAGSPTVESWTRVDTTTTAVGISNMIGWNLSAPAAPVRWVNGLRGTSADQWTPDSFSIASQTLDVGDRVDLGATVRSTEQYLPLLFIDEDAATIYGGVIWSGAWGIGVTRTGDELDAQASFPGISTVVAAYSSLEFPHTFFGASSNTAGASEAALQQFAMQGVRQGRPLSPLVTYNTWFSYGAFVDEASVDEEMHRASAMGVELFVLDAGWYAGAGANGQGDFTSGLGSWAPDPNRFPAQLMGLSDEAHALGMKFGLWVEPERVALALVGQPGLAQEQWLATTDGNYGDGESAQVCLSASAARRWVLTEMESLIDRVHPDYIKWDNNFAINCNRAGHGHGSDDGNLAHVQALYEVLGELRQQYPDLLIENVSGGGNRLDFGMMAYSDVAWMDDRTVPSSHVRHNLEGLSTIFPPAYLLSFVIDSGEEPLESGVFPDVVQSRMPGVLGLTYRFEQLVNGLDTALAAQIVSYKGIRDLTIGAYATLLGPQAPLDIGWDVVEEAAPDGSSAVIFAYTEEDQLSSVAVLPVGLVPDTTYDMWSLDIGLMGSATGADLMQFGLDISHINGARSHIVQLLAR